MRKPALLFSGQGAQYAGMARDLYDRYACVAGLFAEAAGALETDLGGQGDNGTRLKRQMFEGPEDELTRTDVSQLAVFVHSLAVYRVLVSEGFLEEGAVVGAAGLSLGEYTALCAAGALSVADAVRLVKRRGELMQQACGRRPGAMSSIIGLDEETCGEVCREVSAGGSTVVVANLNSPDQVVISGEPAAVAAAAARLKELGAARVVPLKVAGAFHSPLMSGAAEGLKKALSAVCWKPARFPVVANVTGQPAGADAPYLLMQQLTGTVRFADCLSRLAEMDATEYWELGPGKVLAGLARRTVASLPARSIGTVGDIESVRLQV